MFIMRIQGVLSGLLHEWTIDGRVQYSFRTVPQQLAIYVVTSSPVCFSPTPLHIPHSPAYVAQSLRHYLLCSAATSTVCSKRSPRTL